MRAERILVPVDFSPRSRQALRFAVAVARRRGAEIELLHVLAPPSRWDLAFDAYSGRHMPHLSWEDLADPRERMDALMASVDHSGVTLHAKIERGDPAAGIVRVATEDSVDLIVLGTHGRVGVSDWFYGSVAKKLVSCAPCPLVTLRPEVAS
jgi:nucleotide-binding universal stress UspA family protein